MSTTRQAFVRRQQRKRRRLRAVCAEGRLRLSVFRSQRQIYAHIIDDGKHGTLVSATSLEKEIGGKEAGKKDARTKGDKASESDGCALARRVGEVLAERALKLKVERVAFDCGGYQYHGRVRALAEGARDKGLLF